MGEKSESVLVKKFGGYHSLLVEDFDLPPLEGNVEIAVEYGGLNFADLYMRQGLFSDKIVPFVLGMECTGTVTAIGSEQTSLKVGQRVICYDFTGGLYRRTVRINPQKCFPLPDYVDFQTGATIFVNYLTSYFCLFQMGHLQENETVLIQSCTGGVGYAATQLAKTVSGVKVVGTGSPSKEKEAKLNGVDVFLLNESLETEIKNYKFDLIIPNQSGPVFHFLQDLLKPLGRIIHMGANNIIENEEKLSAYKMWKSWWTTKDIPLKQLIINNRVIGGFHLGILLEQEPEKVRKALDYIYQLYSERKVSPRIDSIWKMSEIVSATKVLAERRNVGKVLLQMRKGDEDNVDLN